MSNLTWLLSIGATAAIIELIWWVGVTAYAIKYFNNKNTGDVQ